MSTTAGLGSGDYVAVNGAAVFALLLGMASALIFFADYLLVIPLTCVLVAIVAWVQINTSNGTQTGKALIVLALLLAVGFGGLVSARNIIAWQTTRDDRAAIMNLIDQLGNDIKTGDFQAAYCRFSGRLDSRDPRADLDYCTKFVNP